MANVHKNFTLPSNRSRFECFKRTMFSNPLMFLTPITAYGWVLGTTIGGVMGEFYGNGGGGDSTDRKQGTKLPCSYIVIGDLSEVWDDET